MAPTIVLVRHAQALHNVERDFSIHDPELTELGREQCGHLKASLMAMIPDQLKVTRIVVSPMRRTIETALLAFGDLIAKGVPIVAHAGWQENSQQQCDTGSPIPALQAEFPQVDFSAVDPVYPDKTSPAGARYANNKRAILARAQSALRDLYSLPDEAVIVVSHSGFLRRGVTGRWFINADYRIFDFEEAKDDREPLIIKEWPETERGGLGWSWEERVDLGEGLPEEDLLEETA